MVRAVDRMAATVVALTTRTVSSVSVLKSLAHAWAVGEVVTLLYEFLTVLMMLMIISFRLNGSHLGQTGGVPRFGCLQPLFIEPVQNFKNPLCLFSTFFVQMSLYKISIFPTEIWYTLRYRDRVRFQSTEKRVLV